MAAFINYFFLPLQITFTQIHKKKMKKLSALLLALLLCAVCPSAWAKSFQLKNELVKVAIDKDGNLTSLTNLKTGHNYASGGYLWRMFYDTHAEREIQIMPDMQKARVSCDGKAITIAYDKLTDIDGVKLDMELRLIVTLQGDEVHFASEVANNTEHSVIRELDYPLLHNANMPKDHALIMSHSGGRYYADPIKHILSKAMSTPYMGPHQHFRQRDLHYGGNASMNFFLLAGEKEGVYFGSHDPLIQDTWHGMRVYPDAQGKFTQPEYGLFKYPHCFYGEKWSNDTNIFALYDGTWHKAADKYRAWVEKTWWDRKPQPKWVQEMKSWQRIIFKHQYGDYLLKYTDLNGRVKDAAESVDSNTVLFFGWWKEGFDNAYPNYTEDDTQGGDKAMSKEIKKFCTNGKHLAVYFNGHLIDRNSEFYKSGLGSKVCYKSPSGSEIADEYRFSGMGSWLSQYMAQTFVIADSRFPEWRELLKGLVDRAASVGGSAAFFDQMGKGYGKKVPWDTSREFPVPDTRLVYDKGQTMKIVRDYARSKYGDEFGIGSEHIVDYSSHYVDFTMSNGILYGKQDFTELMRYTFPEIKFSNRNQRDDLDVERRVNMTLLKGLCNDIEIYRCRGLIDQTPRYQAYLAAVNGIRERYKDCFMFGRFRDILGFNSSNKKVQAKSFVGEKRMVVAATNEFEKGVISTDIAVPGYRYVECQTLGNAKVSADGKKVELGQYDLAVLLFEKE